MTIREDILTCVESEVWLNDFHLSAKDDLVLAGSDDWSISKRTLQGGPSAGIDVVTLNNGILSIDVMPTRGMGFWKGTYRGKPLGWKSPVRFPVHPSLVSLDSQRGSGWLTGFNEWMCRCGLKSIGPATNALSEEGGVKSTEHSSTLHGRIANIPAHFVSTMVDTADGGRVSVRGIADESALFGPALRLDTSLHMTAGSNTFEVDDSVTNCSDVPSEMQIMYHINFGPPLLGERCAGLRCD